MPSPDSFAICTASFSVMTCLPFARGNSMSSAILRHRLSGTQVSPLPRRGFFPLVQPAYCFKYLYAVLTETPSAPARRFTMTPRSPVQGSAAASSRAMSPTSRVCSDVRVEAMPPAFYLLSVPSSAASPSSPKSTENSAERSMSIPLSRMAAAMLFTAREILWWT